MSEAKLKNTSPLNSKQINELGHSEVSEVIFYILEKNKKKIKKELPGG